jgi:2-polyprenyl-3-methyl-5-hydroxy-6-metoxy-1,4-benzoquinol methylase
MAANPRSLNQDPVKHAEREFHNQLYASAPAEHFPATAAQFMEIYRRIHLTPFHAGGWSYWGDTRRETFALLGDVRGKRVLDFGCGVGHTGVYLALQGAEVWGFDFARHGVERATQLAEHYGLGQQTRFPLLFR